MLIWQQNEKLSFVCSPSKAEQFPSHGHPVSFQACGLGSAFYSAKHSGMLCFLILDWLTTNSALLETQAWRRFFCVCVLVVLYILCFVVLVTDGCFCLFLFFFFFPFVCLTFPVWCVCCYQFLLLHPLPLCLSWLHRYLSQASWPGCRKTVSLDKLSC